MLIRIPFDCPHCGKNAFIEIDIKDPEVKGVHSDTETRDARLELVTKIVEADVSKELKDRYLSFANAEDTVIFKEDVDNIINEMISRQQNGKYRKI